MTTQEPDWIDAALPSQPATQNGRKVQWQVWMEEKFGSSLWLDFAPEDNWKIESSFGHGTRDDVSLTDGKDSWTIDFKSLSQVNITTLTRRAIRRIVILTEPPVKK